MAGKRRLYRRLHSLKWKTVHVGKGKNKRYMKVAVQRGTHKTVVGKPKRRRT